MKILITGGPVHAKLDAVKIITNKFKGGLMSQLAENLIKSGGVQITYLTSKGSRIPEAGCYSHNPLVLTYHDGFEDYRQQVLNLAPAFDAVVLGAAVSNLIPMNPWKGKFPSHNYKVGDKIPIDFTIAPRVIDEVKKVAPKTHLFGFKLLSDVSHEELITAAYGVLLESKATAVFANDAKDLYHKYCVTKERGEHAMKLEDVAEFIKQCVEDIYYHTVNLNAKVEYPDSEKIFDWYAHAFGDAFKKNPEGYVFGTIAIRNPDGTILTTGRGKNELDDKVVVQSVNHMNYTVKVYGEKKASLNAPLLHWIFDRNPKVEAIVHYHAQFPYQVPTLPYAIPGTHRDSTRRPEDFQTTFNIKDHGCFILFDKYKTRL